MIHKALLRSRYRLGLRERLSKEDLGQLKYHLMLGTFVGGPRTSEVFSAVTASHKHCYVNPLVTMTPSEITKMRREIPQAEVIISGSSGSTEFWSEYFDSHRRLTTDGPLCVHITGFTRPDLMVLVRRLFETGVTQFDALYTEPGQYAKGELTRFVDTSDQVDVVPGYEGSHEPGAGDILIMGTGYEDQLMNLVAERYENAKRINLFGWPSLKPEMYQENVLQARKSTHGSLDDFEEVFAPAYDPFGTAEVLHDCVANALRDPKVRNVYLTPLGTSVQALGFCLYYLTEMRARTCSILFPRVTRIHTNASVGFGRFWRFTIERPSSWRS